MTSLQDLQSVRIEKLEKLKAAGRNPFTARTKRDTRIVDALAQFDELATSQKQITLAGRVMIIRGQGAILFVEIFDGTGRVQLVLKKDEMPEADFALFADTIDMGDFIEATGPMFTTHRGAKSLLIKSWNMLTKAISPLPDKWSGLVDDDERYRKRYLDILMNPELHDLIEKYSKFWRSARQYMLDQGFLEITTPTLETTTGGAEARPFITHHNDFDIPVYLRISVGELWQKRALAAGFEKVFEIGRVYRNEGTSPEHLQEFTNMEFYAGYMDYVAGRSFIQKMVQSVVKETFGTLSFDIKGMQVDLSGEWPVIEYVPYVLEKTGVDVLNATEAEMKAKLSELGVTYEGETRERLTDTLWKYCRKSIAGPVWLTNHPKLVSPLAKSCEDNPLVTERLQLIVAGSEFCNSFSELNDPIDQRARFEEQQKLIDRGDDEAMMPDFEFVEMLEHGMPPAFGSSPVGDRLFAVLAGKPIREIVLFPLMRPKK